MCFVRWKSPFLALRFLGYPTQHGSYTTLNALTENYSPNAGLLTLSEFLQKAIIAQIIYSLTYANSPLLFTS
jgi:hypothetical protein